MIPEKWNNSKGVVSIGRCGCTAGCACSFQGLDESCVPITITGSGTASDKYKVAADLQIDPDSENCLVCGDDGLLLAIDPDEENGLVCREGGLFSSAVTDDVQVFSRDEAALTVGSGTNVLMLPFNIEILGVSAAVGTAPTGADLILDVNMDGVTIFTTQANRPTIAAGNTDTGVEVIPNIVTIPSFSHLTVDRDQIGSAIAGGYLSLFIRYRST